MLSRPRALVCCVLLLASRCSATASSAPNKRPFTVADDIRFSYFGDPFGGEGEPFVASPDHRYFLVESQHGRLDVNRCESTVRVYATADVKRLLAGPPGISAPPPLWAFSEATSRNGPVITMIRWLRDSREFGFLAKSASGEERLFLADVGTRTIRALTPANQSVRSFDIRDASHYVYTVISPSIRERIEAESRAVSVVATGRRIFSLLSPTAAIRWHDLSELWGVIGNRRIRVDDPGTHEPLSIYARGQMALGLSPDGHTVVTALPVPDVPADWATRYPAPFPGDARHIHVGPQDLDSIDGYFDVSRYALIDIANDTIRALPLGPLGYEADWIGMPYTDWSRDGTRVAVTDTFLARRGGQPDESNESPCAAVIDVASLRADCVEPVYGAGKNGLHEPGFRLVTGIAFDRRSRDRVVVSQQYPGDVRRKAIYALSSSGQWELKKTAADSDASSPVELSIRQNMNDPPVLVATDTESGTSRMLWNPNAWLARVELTRVDLYQWKDAQGRVLIGGLYEPRDYVPGKRYPLIIQAHGFSPDEFIPSGVYPTGFAARELAAAGFLVLQVRGCPIRRTPEEGPCQVGAYEGAVKQLEAEGRIDRERIGIVGFSRTCYYTLEALTTSWIRFRAAAITDGVDMGYMQYMIEDQGEVPDGNSVIGAPPFGAGLRKWVERSPEFNMNRVTTPLLVVGVGEGGVLTEWEPYATLWHQNKPVDFILLKEGTHPLTNPAERMVSQSSTVDWMCFWLKNEEAPGPAKREQYRRWNRLRDLETGALRSSTAQADSREGSWSPE
jgi:dipeptidyl aminopeptidase/acylaminoacyl peptidase